MKIEKDIYPSGQWYKEMIAEGNIFERFGRYTVFEDRFLPDRAKVNKKTEEAAQIYILKNYIKEKTKFINEAKIELNKLSSILRK